MLEKFALHRFEYGIASRIKKAIIIFPVLVDNHYIVLAYKEGKEKAQLMVFDSVSPCPPTYQLRDLVQYFKTFIATKKKLIGKRRHSKGNDHGRCFREHFVDCPSDTLKALSSQYEALTMLRDLSVQANLARPPAATLGQSLAELFVSGSCSDITLVYRGHRIPAHRTILMARCPYFRYCK